jgi:peptidoglycan/xylan/chitin deacetylase (PgdA/CDA1 family)
MRTMRLVEARRGIADRVVALTFDDGPSPWTEPIAEQLERHGGRGTFFAMGEEVDPDEGRRIVRRLLAAGHEVGNHTWTHADLEQIDEETIGSEMRHVGPARRGGGVPGRLLACAVLPLR